MKTTTRLCAAVASSMALAWIAADARAEAFVDVYSGAAFTVDDGATDAGFTSLLGSMTVRGTTDFEVSPTAGIRGGYWASAVPWVGFAADFSWFQPDEDASNGAEIQVLAPSILMMVRVPIMTTEEIPGGRVQPYAAVGPGFFFATVKDAGVAFPLGTFRDTEFNVGLDARGGLKVQLTDRVAVFGEYRYTYFTTTWRDDPGGVNFFIDAALQTHHVNVGVGFHF